MWLTALSIWEKQAPESVYAVLTLNNLAFLYKRLGRQEEAMSLVRRGFSMAERLPVNDHATQLSLLINIAVFHEEMRDCLAAEASYKKALAVSEGRLGPAHPVVGQLLLGYAGVLKKLKREAEAKEFRLRGEALLRETEFSEFKRHTVDISELSRRR